MNEALSELIGKRIQITTLGASTRYTDTGILESYAHPWLRLRKDSGQLLWIAAYHVRLIELA